jgi:sugar phosphate isomerase/epimerase
LRADAIDSRGRDSPWPIIPDKLWPKPKIKEKRASLLAKIHVKDYLLDPADPNGRGKSVNIREGSVRWPVLRQALEAVNYNGWMTIEGNSSISFAERNRRLDLILAGQ